MNQTRSQILFEEAKKLFPGGVNSPVRAFRSVGGTPLFIEKGKGYRIWDADGTSYIDFCGSWGPLILGHADERVLSAIKEAVESGTTFGAPTAAENKLGKFLLKQLPFLDKMRFVSSGTEAVMSAIRLARGYTTKNKIIKFEGCYHGHTDSLLVKAGSGLVTFGNASSAGIPIGVSSDTLVLPLDDESAVNEAFSQYQNEIAAIIIEPIPANNGLLLQRKEFLEFLRKRCSEEACLLIFDEVISGFRTSISGAVGTYGVIPDIVTYGKIVGGGLPVGAYGARAPIMNSISPEGPVYQAGTLSGNPIAMAAGFAQLSACSEPGFYEELDKKCAHFIDQIKRIADQEKGYRIFRMGSIFWLAFTSREYIRKSDQIDPVSMEKFRRLYHLLLENGVYLGPSGYEVGFISQAHTMEILNEAAAIFGQCLNQVLSSESSGS